MSEILGTAAVLIRPDTTKFRAELAAELAAATKGIVVPVQIAAAATGGAGVAAAAGGAAALEKNAVAAAAATAGIGVAAASTVHPLSQVAAAMTGVSTTMARAVKVTGDYTVASRSLTPALATEARLAQLAAVAENERLLALKAAVPATVSSAVAAKAEAAANRSAAVAARESAAAHEAFARGAGATGLSLLKVRGATLAASGPFLVGAAAVTILAKSYKAFVSEQEAASRAEAVFGVQTEQLVRNAHGLAASFGLSTEAALKYEGAIGLVFKTVRVADAANAQFSESFVKLAADVAAFNNVPTVQVLRAFQLALSGNLRGLRQFVPAVTAAEITQRALADSGKKTAVSLTQQELVLARYEVITKRASDQVGAFADRSGHAAEQSKILRSNLENLAASIGGPVVAVFRFLTVAINDTFSAAKKLEGIRLPGITSGGTEEDFQRLLSLKQGLASVKPVLDETLVTLKAFSGEHLNFNDLLVLKNALDADAQSARDAQAPFVTLENIFRNFQAAVNSLSFASATAQIDSLQRHFLDLTFVGASSARKIADLQKQIAAAQDIIRNPAVSPTSGRGRAAAETRNRAQAEIQSIRAADKAARDQSIADAKAAADKAASDAKAAAAAVQQKLDQADQDFLDALGLGRGVADIGLLRAQQTKGLEDDVKAQNAITSLLSRSIAAAKSRIHNVLLRAQTVQELTTALVQSQAATKALIATEKQEAIDHKKLLADRAAERLDLSIQIAETNKNVAQEIALRQARIKADTIRLNNVHGDLVRRKQLQLEIAQDTQAIKDLKKQNDAKNNAGQELAFSFLQTQQGFAANLLSNLLPLNSIAGTVGGGAISTPSASAPGPATPLAQQAAVAAAGAGGVTAGQGTAQIVVLRQILAVLHRLAGDRQHPEAHNQRVTGSADMAYPTH